MLAAGAIVAGGGDGVVAVQDAAPELVQAVEVVVLVLLVEFLVGVAGGDVVPPEAIGIAVVAVGELVAVLVGIAAVVGPQLLGDAAEPVEAGFPPCKRKTWVPSPGFPRFP